MAFGDIEVSWKKAWRPDKGIAKEILKFYLFHVSSHSKYMNKHEVLHKWEEMFNLLGFSILILHVSMCSNVLIGSCFFFSKMLCKFALRFFFLMK